MPSRKPAVAAGGKTAAIDRDRGRIMCVDSTSQTPGPGAVKSLGSSMGGDDSLGVRRQSRRFGMSQSGGYGRRTPKLQFVTSVIGTGSSFSSWIDRMREPSLEKSPFTSSGGIFPITSGALNV